MLDWIMAVVGLSLDLALLAALCGAALALVAAARNAEPAGY